MIGEYPLVRPLAALAVVVVIVGGVWLYFNSWEGVEPSHYVEQPARGVFSLEITLTFEAGPDPFSLEATDAPSLLVTLGSREVLRVTEPIAPGEPILVENVTGLVEKENEFFLVASPADAAALQSHAVRVRVLRDGDPIGEASLWSEPGQPVEGPVRVTLPSTAASDDNAEPSAAGEAEEATP